MSKRVAVIGEGMAEFQRSVLDSENSFTQTFGGDTLNTAIYLARLGGHRVSYFTALGCDSLSSQLVALCEAEGVDMSHAPQLHGRTIGAYYIETDDSGERTFTYWRSDSAARHWLSDMEADMLALEQQLRQFDVVYLSGITLAIQFEPNLEKLFTVLERLKSSVEIVFDSNYRPRLWASRAQTRQVYERMMAIADHAFLTFDDEQQLFDDPSPEQTLERLMQFPLKSVVIKCGAEACLVLTDRLETVPACQVETVVDTTSAGDSFNAGYLHAHLLGHTPSQAAELGHRLASTVIQYYGAVIPRTAMSHLME